MSADVEGRDGLVMNDEHELEKIRQLADSIVKLCSSTNVFVLHKRADQLQQLYDSWVHGFEVLIKTYERPKDSCHSGAGGDIGCLHSSPVSAENELAQVKIHSLVSDEFQSEIQQPSIETVTHAFDDQGITFNLNANISAGSSCCTPAVCKQGPAADSLMSLEVTNGTSVLPPSDVSDSEDVMDVLITRSLLESRTLSPAISCGDFQQGDIFSDFTTLPADHGSSWGNNFVSKQNVFDTELNLSYFQVSCKQADDLRNSTTPLLDKGKEMSLVCSKEGKNGENVLVRADAQTLVWHGDDESRNGRQNDSAHQSTVNVRDVVNANSDVNAAHQSDSNSVQEERDYNGNANTVKDVVSSRSRQTRQTVFKCDHCGKELVTYEGLVEHVRLHTDERPYKCRYCDKSFLSSSHRANHHRIHNRSAQLNCDYCEKSFVRLSALQVHLRQHTGERPYSCDLCDKSYPSIYTLKDHKIVTHERIKRFKCQYCNTEFFRSSKLHNHMRRHTGERPFKCQQCDKSYRTPSTLAKHKQVHTRTVGMLCKCDVCEQEFPDRKHLFEHRRIASHNKERVNCNDCSKTFTSLATLRIHIDVVHNKNACHVCQFCGKMWPSSQALELHIRTHTGEKPFQCNVCSKRFIAKEHLDRHMMIHSGEKPYKCHKCDKSFTQSFSLVQHLRIHNNDRPHKCQLCDKAFHQSYALVKHMNTHAVVNSKK